MNIVSLDTTNWLPSSCFFCCHVTGILHFDWLVKHVLEGCQLGLRPHPTHKNKQDRLHKSCSALAVTQLKSSKIKLDHCLKCTTKYKWKNKLDIYDSNLDNTSNDQM